MPTVDPYPISISGTSVDPFPNTAFKLTYQAFAVAAAVMFLSLSLSLNKVYCSFD